MFTNFMEPFLSWEILFNMVAHRILSKSIWDLRLRCRSWYPFSVNPFIIVLNESYLLSIDSSTFYELFCVCLYGCLKDVIR
jgi:ubiquitin-protein ligase